MERLQRTRLATFLILGLVFGTGVVVGMAVDRMHADATPADETATAENTRDRSRGRDRGERDGYIWEGVSGLTDGQRARIDSILEVSGDSTRVLWRHYRKEWEPFDEAWHRIEEERDARMDSLFRDTRAAIKDVMTAEQVQQYDSLIADWERRAEERRRRDRRDRSDNRRE